MILAHRHTKRSSIWPLPDVVIQELLRLVHDFLIIVELIASHAGTGLQNRACIVIPFQSCVRLIPVDNPSEIPRIYICCKTLFIAM